MLSLSPQDLIPRSKSISPFGSAPFVRRDCHGRSDEIGSTSSHTPCSHTHVVRQRAAQTENRRRIVPCVEERKFVCLCVNILSSRALLPLVFVCPRVSLCLWRGAHVIDPVQWTCFRRRSERRWEPPDRSDGEGSARTVAKDPWQPRGTWGQWGKRGTSVTAAVRGGRERGGEKGYPSSCFFVD